MEEKNKQNSKSIEMISIKELILEIKKWWKYFLGKWFIILIVGLIGGALGLAASYRIKPKYTAQLSFALIEGDGTSGLADIASSFGISLFGGNSDAFSGDNLLEIIQSKHAIEQTLLSPVLFKGEQKTLADAFIQISGYRLKWNKNKKVPELKTLSYPIGQNRETFTRVQDSILNLMYKIVSNPKSLSIARKNKKISIVNMNFTSSNENFAKLFVETLMEQTYRFYSQTRTSQIRSNVEMMEHTADSIKGLYEAALYKGAGYSSANINPALSLAAVPRIKQETNAQLYGTVYTEVLKNLETLKLDLARTTPIVQIIDTPRYPLFKKKLGRLTGVVFGGILGGFFIIGYLFLIKYIKDNQ